MKKGYILIFSLFSFSAFAQNNDAVTAQVSTKADALQSKIVAWRRDFHEHPELGNHEVRTSGIIAKHLQSLGIQVQTGIATTGVVGIIKGDKPGPVVALRADMDGLPVIERTPVPFASKVKTTYNGQEVGVMHACGHDSHMAILMAVAQILSTMKSELHGTVKFIFQPAEEGVEPGQKGGAEEMVKEGVLENPKVDAIFGLHINSQTEVGKITYRPGGTMAGVNDMQIIVKGRSAHGAYPWSSIDPIVVSAEIINNLQTIVSRNIDVTQNPAVVTIGAIKAGNRSNIIPESAEMLGTLRSFTLADEKLLIERVKQIATKTAEAQGATAEVKIPYSNHYPVTFNDVKLTEKMLPSLQHTAGTENVLLRPPVTGAEDFSFYQEKVPGLFFFLGGMPKGQDPLKAPSHHTPDFFIDESGFTLGVKALCNLTLDYMNSYGK
ncbi:carboxypeptidase Ss1. Metallo peptidase. MEROPS family M20D [Mucilaginibacter sp. OK268]|uniref:amidohydrolase n=1 Tax=Mucilaginibacter sp. OK268 TaxID=1881048 RepID=UPI00088D211D|nr:amidohydrolase [Mucilaginibacter sp. OK268]SDQ00761.1 carboxypeptidase Ss1. Metallo peptidase. MEROPS family M20D [Mucilaginibacter sp. OK268]